MSDKYLSSEAKEKLVWVLRPKRLSNNYWRRVGTGILIYPNVALNPGAAEIWDMCDGTKRLCDILFKLCKDSSEAESSVVLDLLYTIYRLADCGAILFVREGSD